MKRIEDTNGGPTVFGKIAPKKTDALEILISA